MYYEFTGLCKHVVGKNNARNNKRSSIDLLFSNRVDPNSVFNVSFVSFDCA